MSRALGSTTGGPARPFIIGVAGGTESDLGTNGSGLPRPNGNSCP